jgi:dephospho-CoA kinase
MTLYGLTGGIGMGKTTCAAWIASRDIPVIDTDQLARQLVEPGQPALEDIARRYGSQVIDPAGRLHREQLATIIFADTAARSDLEAILHPRIREAWRGAVQRWRSEGRRQGVVVIPLLYETGAERELDQVICAACSPRTQAQRLRERGWSDEQIHQRAAAQLPADEKVARADRVVWTEGIREVTWAQLRAILGA